MTALSPPSGLPNCAPDPCWRLPRSPKDALPPPPPTGADTAAGCQGAAGGGLPKPPALPRVPGTPRCLQPTPNPSPSTELSTGSLISLMPKAVDGDSHPDPGLTTTAQLLCLSPLGGHKSARQIIKVRSEALCSCGNLLCFSLSKEPKSWLHVCLQTAWAATAELQPEREKVPRTLS